MTREEMRAVAERHVAAENVQDVASALATYHSECFYESMALGTRFTGKDQVAMQYGALFAAIPDAETSIEGEAYGDDVLVHWGTFRGRMTGEFFGLPPTGRSIALPFVAILPFKDGLMEGERLFFDLATFCDQAGLSLSAVQNAARMLRTALHGSSHAETSLTPTP